MTYAGQLGHSVVAITEHETIANAIKIEKEYKEIKKQYPNLKLVRGNEIYLCRNGLLGENFERGIDKYYHFILLAKNAQGHQQIRELSTRAWLRSYMAGGLRRTPTYYQDLLDIIGKNPGNVIGSTGCLGGFLDTKLLQWYKNGKPDELYQQIVNWCYQIQAIFGKGNFYFELQPSANDEQEIVNKELLKLSEATNIPYIITTDSHYLKKKDAPIHEAFLNSQNGDREVKSFYATTYLMSTDELESYVNNYMTKGQLKQAYNNILDIANCCEDYSLLKPLKIPTLGWRDLGNYTIDQKKWVNRIPYLEKFWESSYEGDKYLADAIVLKLESDPRLQYQESYDELNSNLEMTWVSSEVNKTHWSAYFLNLQGVIDACWSAGSLVGPGRGSGVGFYLLYILDLIQINPLWESTQTFPWRFLNPDRVSVLD